MCSLLVLFYFLDDNGCGLDGLPATMPWITGPCCNILEQSSIDHQCKRIVKRNGTGNLIISGALLASHHFPCSELMIDVLPMLLTWRCKLWFQLTARRSISIWRSQMTTNQTSMPSKGMRLALYVLLRSRFIISYFFGGGDLLCLYRLGHRQNIKNSYWKSRSAVVETYLCSSSTWKFIGYRRMLCSSMPTPLRMWVSLKSFYITYKLAVSQWIYLWDCARGTRPP